jgi:hypothetical protein
MLKYNLKEGIRLERIIISSENYAQYNYIFPKIKYCAEDRYEEDWKLRERTIL